MPSCCDSIHYQFFHLVNGKNHHQQCYFKSLKAPNTAKAELANTVDPDDMAHNELSHLDTQCLLSSPY